MGPQLAFWWVSVFDYYHASNIWGRWTFRAHFANSRWSRRRKKQSKGKLKLILLKTIEYRKWICLHCPKWPFQVHFFVECWEREISIFFFSCEEDIFKRNCLDVISNSEIVLPVLLTTLHSEYVLGFLLRKYFEFIDFWHSSFHECAFHQ